MLIHNHRYKRLIHKILDHNPTEEDITKFFTRFQRILKARGLSLYGITTDGSPLYPSPIARVFGSIQSSRWRRSPSRVGCSGRFWNGFAA